MCTHWNWIYDECVTQHAGAVVSGRPRSVYSWGVDMTPSHTTIDRTDRRRPLTFRWSSPDRYQHHCWQVVTNELNPPPHTHRLSLSNGLLIGSYWLTTHPCTHLLVDFIPPRLAGVASVTDDGGGGAIHRTWMDPNSRQRRLTWGHNYAMNNECFCFHVCFTSGGKRLTVTWQGQERMFWTTYHLSQPLAHSSHTCIMPCFIWAYLTAHPAFPPKHVLTK